MAELSYLVMTAADCFAHNEEHRSHGILSLNDMLEQRAAKQPDDVCVAFSRKGSDGTFDADILTFSQLFAEVCKTAYILHHDVSPPLSLRESGDFSRKTVALLAPSCKEFLVNAFALFRLGLGVLLVAPQNTPEDIAHLCSAVDASHLIFHDSMRTSATAASKLPGATFHLTNLVLAKKPSTVTLAKAIECRSGLTPAEESDTECIIFHSSGSSGTPKPIAQKHRTWTVAAACKPHSPAFTTTPLFHGGISDLLRTMMSKSALYMYPSTLPITSDNLLKAFKATPLAPTSFLSVPYILEMLGETEEGIRVLADFELVSTGGSPLPQATGDCFCDRGVNLVSRYGSSECGFLMTSFRDFASDKDWSYLRPAAGKNWLTFEDQGDGSHELVVPPEWPTRSKSNRDDGSFATSDLFRKHPSTANAWMLSGRADDVILMINGEKASPAPLEAVLKQSSELVRDALVFGSNRASLGVAIIPANSAWQREGFLSLVSEANKIAPAHAQISPELLILLPSSAEFPRASKGSLQRGRAYEAFAKEIGDAYAAVGTDDGQNNKLNLSGSALTDYISKAVKDILGTTSVGQDDDLFSAGLNSLQSVRLRNAIQKVGSAMYSPNSSQVFQAYFKRVHAQNIDTGSNGALPTNLVFECGTIANLASYIEERRDRGCEEDVDRDLALMKDLAARSELVAFENPQNLSTSHPNGHAASPGLICVLTGATGSLGAQLIPELLAREDVREIVCLCRAESPEQARQRVLESLGKQLIALDPRQEERLRCLPSRFNASHLGLDEQVYRTLSDSRLLIIHAAWPVHFGAGLGSFVSHLEGLRHLIDLAAMSPTSCIFFCSSTASVLGTGKRDVPERLSTKAEDAVAMGYARSKHVAETICNAAWQSSMRGRIGVLRLGQLCGDTKNGIWKAEEGWPLLIGSVGCVGCLPDLAETLSWLPLDRAAQAICDVTFDGKALPIEAADVPIFHVVSKNDSKTFRDVLTAIKRAGIATEVVPADQWLDRLHKAQKEGSEHVSLKMLDMWQKAYGSSPGPAASEPIFETIRVEALTDKLDAAVSPELLAKMVAYWQKIELLPGA